MGYDYEKRGTAYDRDRRWNSEKQKWEYPVVHHIDGNPLNNDTANLILVWPSDNARVRASHYRAANEPMQKGSKK